jgi:hypothetical protein
MEQSLLKRAIVSYSSLSWNSQGSPAHMSPPSDTILSHTYPGHMFGVYLLKSASILPSHLRLSLQSNLLQSDFRTKIVDAFPTSPVRYTCPAHTFLCLEGLIISGEKYKLWSCTMCHFLQPLFTLRCKYSPCHLVLKQTPTMFFTQNDWPYKTGRGREGELEGAGKENQILQCFHFTTFTFRFALR